MDKPDVFGERRTILLPCIDFHTQYWEHVVYFRGVYPHLDTDGGQASRVARANALDHRIVDSVFDLTVCHQQRRLNFVRFI